jgi:DNA polymerase-3 subunit beta
LVEIEFPEIYNLLPDTEIMIFSQTLNEITKFEQSDYELLLYFEKDALYMEKPDDTKLFIAFKDQPFPDYSAIYDYHVTGKALVRRMEFLDGLKKMINFMERKENEIELSFSGQGRLIMKVSEEVGEAEHVMNADYEGGAFRLYLSPTQLVQAVQVMESEQVELSFTGPEGPCIIRGEQDEGFITFLMPLVEEGGEGDIQGF